MLSCRNLKKEINKQVKKIIPLSLGYLACLNGYCNGAAAVLMKDKEKEDFPNDHPLQRFWCSKCDNSNAADYGACSTSMKKLSSHLSFDYACMQSLFFELLFDESSEEVQVACIRTIQRILLHATEEVLLKTRSQWVQCINILLLHKNKNLRQVFGSQISFFLREPILENLFPCDDAANKSKEQRFMDSIKHALAAAEEPLVFETLLETAAKIMQTVDIHSQLFLFSLTLLIDQLDNVHITVRLIASKLINRSCNLRHTRGLEALLSRVPQVRNELYYYLCMRLVSQPKMVEEFSTAVLGVETEELIKRMIPVALPRLVVFQHDYNLVLATIRELARLNQDKEKPSDEAKRLDTDMTDPTDEAKRSDSDMVELIVNRIPQVLAFALHQTDGQKLKSALQFYHELIGSDNQEIFSAAVPALLEELICFSDVDDPEEISKRYEKENMHKSISFFGKKESKMYKLFENSMAYCSKSIMGLFSFHIITGCILDVLQLLYFQFSLAIRDQHGKT